MFAFLRNHWLAIALWLLLIAPLGAFLVVSGAIAAYIYWPTGFDRIDMAQFDVDSAHSVVMVHGVKDDANSWVAPLEKVYEQKVYEGTHYGGSVIGLDWSPYAQSSLSCAIQGKRIGHRAGQRLAASKSLTSLHLIAHSCGAFVIYGACQALKQVQPNVVVQTTYLDPVSVYGLFWDYGIEHFGDCADYSEAYIDTGDDVPGSNQLLPHTHTYDVTAIREQSGRQVPPHLWPIAYYRDLVVEGKALSYRQDPTLKNRKPAGELERLP